MLTVFNPLPDSALDALDTGLGVVSAAIQLAKAGLNAELVSIDILLKPLLDQKKALQALEKTIKSQFNLLDPSLALKCVSVGKINEIMTDAMSVATDKLDMAIAEINRITAVKGEYTAKVASMESQLDFFTSVKSVIQNIKSSRTSVQSSGTIK